MKSHTFKKTRLATSLSLVLGMGASISAMAQEAPAQAQNSEIEVISVTGIRGSLTKSMDVKRGSSGIVDAISAEDIGKFPDTNLAESLQRISGVSIDRVNGEGSKVSVRGFGADYNLVTLNGRQMPVTTGSRSFDFANIASDLISGVEVHKTSFAADPTGGIGSTINVQTLRPLSYGNTKAIINFAAVSDSSTEEGSSVTPELSGIYSTTFDNNKFGVLVSASYQERDSGSQQANVGTGWRSFPGITDNDWSGGNADWGGVPQDNQVNRPGPGDVYSVPQTTIYKFEEQQRTRTNGQLVLQYAPTDAVKATLDYTYMRNDIDTQYNDVSAWFTFAPSQNVWTDGPVSSPLIYSETYDTPADLSMAAGDYGVRNESGSLGFNIEWQASNALKLTFDAHNSTAEYKPNHEFGSNNTLSTAAFIRTSAATDFSKDLPLLAVGGGNSVQPSDMVVTGSVFGSATNKSDIDQYQLTGEYVFEEKGSIDFGIALNNVDNHSKSVNVQRNDWGGVGQAGDFDESFFPADTIHDKFTASKGDFSLASGQTFEVLNRIFMWDFAKLRDRAEELYTPAGYVGAGDCGTDFCPSTDYASDVDRYTEEESQSLFVQYNYESDFNGRQYDFHIGVRYEKTDVTSTSAVASYDGANWIAETEIELQATGIREFQTQKGSYDYFLPSINFNIEVIDDVMLRAAYSETIGRPDYVAIQGGTVVNTLANRGGGGGSSGNPSLLPLESKNIDFSAEWYYAPSSYASIGYFRKDTSNFISNTVVESTIYNIPNPVNGQKYAEAIAAVGSDALAIRNYIFANYPNAPGVDVANGVISGVAGEDNDLVFKINTPSNSDVSEVIDGWEFAIQHVFGESGVGVLANYTLVNSENEYNNFILADQPAILGISDTANAVLFYEKDGFQARIAYNWRDEFLSSRGQDTGANPQYTEAYSQIDVSASYDLPMVEGLSVYVEALNITDEYKRVHGRAKEQVLSLVEAGPRYSIGARYTF
ncbi:TonB-dependent receptor [Rheinheimera baltica]|uniref:TonB-dependent receptor n=1 Tax=Rheinheimera baltica TaxID=67576 RepID=A0ABT9I1J3_9GAMM|nr:TonB-dependent receptor [Rheinheimera baltica]MDP5137256.1 TonB-dependent receptor [Rheinheimera baltica]MDP5143706.1 TonB-dependent receptor [Rheinheimera baltica]